MRILVDECLPRRLAKALAGHQVQTVQQAGWSQKTNGELLGLAQGLFEVFITIDSHLVHQQNLTNLQVAVVVLRAKSNKFEDVEPLIPGILRALQTIKPGQIVKISL